MDSLLSYSYSSGKTVLTVNIRRVMPLLAGLMTMFMCGNLALACGTQFQCLKYLPTPGYLGCFRGHDRIFIMSCSFYALVLPLVFTGVYSQTRTSASVLEKWLLVGAGTAVTLLLPITALMNEVTSEHILPFEEIYEWTSRGTVLAVLVWLFTAFKCLSREKQVFTSREQGYFRWMVGLVVLISGLCIVLLVNSIADVMTSLSEALCEWTLCILSIWAPALVSHIVRGLHLSFTTISLQPPKSLELASK